jgi:hypothetical protein
LQAVALQQETDRASARDDRNPSSATAEDIRLRRMDGGLFFRYAQALDIRNPITRMDAQHGK